jgi:hypothetical protein
MMFESSVLLKARKGSFKSWAKGEEAPSPAKLPTRLLGVQLLSFIAAGEDTKIYRVFIRDWILILSVKMLSLCEEG